MVGGEAAPGSGTQAWVLSPAPASAPGPAPAPATATALATATVTAPALALPAEVASPCASSSCIRARHLSAAASGEAGAQRRVGGRVRVPKRRFDDDPCTCTPVPVPASASEPPLPLVTVASLPPSFTAASAGD